MAYSHYATTTAKTLAALSPPGPPSELKTTIGSDKVILRWIGPPEATGYVVEWRKGSGTWNAGYSGPNNQATISGLTPDTEYEFRLKATNAAGESAWATVTVKTRIDEDFIRIIRPLIFNAATQKTGSTIKGV